MKPLKKIIPNNENFFDHQFYIDSLKKMYNRLYSFDIDGATWRESRMRHWPNTILEQIIDQGKLNETIKQKNTKL